ncbi:hypothetical protein ABZ816_13550 [Actinosynnema sp. NPDC047251]|uniref:hypothetical protein n=1 Tax=Saccharothrix espanaensis TaxID=103731 RepID=UPI0011DD6FAE|nr:hypothetical protein [Saccharothrix espanaensis]
MLLHGLVGLAVLLVLWPTRAGATRFLRRWGVPEPTQEQETAAIRYLRTRRLLYPPLFVLVPAAATALAGPLHLASPTWGPPYDFAALIVALLLAETVVALRPVRGVRVAALTPRRWHDLVPRSAVVLLLALFGTAVVFAVADLTARPWAQHVATTAEGLSPWYRDEMLRPSGVLVLLGVLLGAVAVFGVVALAVRRAPIGDPESDAALRTRSARVVVGIGLGWAGAMASAANARLSTLYGLRFDSPDTAPAWFAVVPATGWLGMIVLIVSLGGWMWVANPAKPAAAPAVAGAV